MNFEIKTYPLKPFEGQKTGTSGLRKKVKVFEQPGYLEAFVQSIFYALPGISGSGFQSNSTDGPVLVLGGDGRYFNKEAIRTILRLAAANKVRKVLVGQRGLLCTPAVSAIIRARKLAGGIILTASHNPGGPNADFGIKYNTSDGGPAPESYTDVFYEWTRRITEYRIAVEVGTPDRDPFTQVSLDCPRVYEFSSVNENTTFTIEVIDSANDYVNLLKQIFDFGMLKELFCRSDFSMLFDALHGVTGPYGKRIFVDELGAPLDWLRNYEPLEDFGGGHPDPNLVYAADLVSRCDPLENPSAPQFGAASDGDGDRNMVLGRGFFVTPSDSLAVIVAYAKEAIPYFRDGRLVGVARSMPTASAVDKVAAEKNLDIFETPTGWKYFSNLLSSGKAQICGEESFGTSSDHIREKDGLWAILCWLSILAYRNVGKSPIGSFIGVQQIVEEHWKIYGRNFFTRYDYEECDATAAGNMMSHLRQYQEHSDYSVLEKVVGQPVIVADDFTYIDPVDKSVAKNQGLRFVFANGSRIIFRLSGTGSSGATIRMYIEKYETDRSKIFADTAEALNDLIHVALNVSRLEAFTGRTAPTVIT
jgi:phosphoglucomutase